MCTAAAYLSGDFYFGRTLDLDISYGEQVTMTPRRFPLTFRNGQVLQCHYAILGMAHVAHGYPLYYDGINERGLAMAGLNFVGNARYGQPEPGKCNLAHFELIPWILGSCADVAEAEEALREIVITEEAFSDDLPPARLHWLLADRTRSITLETTDKGLQVYDNPAGILTNNPPFPMQMFHLHNFLHLNTGNPDNTFCAGLDLRPYSCGMGAMGLPGDWSSQSRFVRVAFVKGNSVSPASEAERVSQFFHILGTVNQPLGTCIMDHGGLEHTAYTSCCNADRGIYYYTTYNNRRITAVELHRCDLDGQLLTSYPLIREEQIFRQN